MRSHLSKAKRIDNGQWVEGYYQQRYDSFGTLEHLICYSKSANVWGKINVDPKTLCDDTELTDHDGRKIWENDIIRLHDFTAEDYIVTWSKEMGAYVICSAITKLEFPDLVGDCVQECPYTEVVGNVFDNPELLKEHNLYCENNKRNVEAEHEFK